MFTSFGKIKHDVVGYLHLTSGYHLPSTICMYCGLMLSTEYFTIYLLRTLCRWHTVVFYFYSMKYDWVCVNSIIHWLPF
jgi:hypothetical protein